MSTTEEATVNPDGSTTFENGGGEESYSGDYAEGGDAAADMEEKGVDPAIYLLAGAFVFALLWFFIWYRRKKAQDDSNNFFSELDGEKFNLKLPAAVDEYYEVKAKCEEAGWEPGQGAGQGAAAANANGPHRVLAQALMKRCIADIPIVTHIQKESPGMNKLYSQSMCSVKQWRSYQAAEAMVSAEVDEVRAEADEIEPGWSQVIWRQAMQYHNMLKQRHEVEAKAMAAQAEKRQAEEDKVEVDPEQKKKDDAKAKEVAAEKAAAELIKSEEREKESQKAFKDGSMKKGFLASSTKKK
uniref:Uncharacterized protein n=1 Tax=Ditylum brightwellii TaxID=49249 RepID=A0A6U3U3N1_9STRA|mmetsp:Transcript_32769/g.43688  ORF Transcript_32769/g.43688 Transcript_32769/m.43688 type:complete len:298 (-) Transcript_32769:43-936(-)